MPGGKRAWVSVQRFRERPCLRRMAPLRCHNAARVSRLFVRARSHFAHNRCFTLLKQSGQRQSVSCEPPEQQSSAYAAFASVALNWLSRDGIEQRYFGTVPRVVVRPSYLMGKAGSASVAFGHPTRHPATRSLRELLKRVLQLPNRRRE